MPSPTIAEIRAELDRMDAAGVASWRQEVRFEELCAQRAHSMESHDNVQS